MSEEVLIKRITVTPICENCYVLHNRKEALVFDPGGDYPVIKKFLAENGLSVRRILATHGHFDHTGAAAAMKEDYGADFLMHEADVEFMKDGASHAAMYGMGPYTPPEVDKTVAGGDIVEFAGNTVKAIHTPGHTKGGLSFFIEPLNILISGDTLFFESVGRTDFENGDYDEIVKSIKERLYVLPDNVKVFPGHGPSTSVGHEKSFNPFVRG